MNVNFLPKALEAITGLGDPTRRRLYEAVSASDQPLSRTDVALATGVARPLVAYHLDRLVKDGLLSIRFERQSGRSGPGAGRPAKLYFRPRTPVKVVLPARDTEFAALLLARAVVESGLEDMHATFDRLAEERGAELARDEPSVDGESTGEILTRLLRARGYEPRHAADGTVWLRNCVFDELASQQPQLICGMNLSLIRGMLKALPDSGLEARLDPGEGRCCVVLAETGTDAGSAVKS